VSDGHSSKEHYVEMPIELAVLYRDELREYDFGPGHPFRGDRYQVFPEFLREKLTPSVYQELKADWATDDDLSRICASEYIDYTRAFFRATSSGLYYNGDFYRFHSGDNRPAGTPGNVEKGARLIVGQAKLAVDLIQQETFSKVVSLGGGMHHAKESYGEGFCIYNDVAFTAKYLLEEYGHQRILILDTDAHAGNGTCAYFYEDPRVLFIDMHQDPMTLYPGTGFVHEIGANNGRGFTINVPLPPYAGYGSYEHVFDEIIQPVTEEFMPQIIIRNGGSDPHFDDGLTRLGLTVSGFKMIGDRVRQMSTICDGEVVDLIASGYNREVLPYAWLALVSGLGGIETTVEEPSAVPPRFQKDPSFDDTKAVVREIKRNLASYWRSLT